MLKEERHRRILNLLGSNGKVIAADLCEQLHVSEDTVRRDLQELDENGQIMRVHGGALSRLAHTPPYAERRTQRLEAKSAIGRAAAGLVRQGQVLFMDGGTTTLQVARSLPKSLKATVITNSPPLALDLGEHAALEVILLGGKLLKESQVVVGAETVEQILRFRADLLFLGTCAIHPKQGVTVPHLEEAYVKRAMIAHAAVTIGVATAEKLNTVEPYVVAPVTGLSHLVTEASANAGLLKKYRGLGVSVITA